MSTKTPRASVKMPGERGGHSGEQTHRCVSRRVVVAADGVSAGPSWARRRTGARRTSGIGRAAEVRKVAGASTRRSTGRADTPPRPARSHTHQAEGSGERQHRTQRER